MLFNIIFPLIIITFAGYFVHRMHYIGDNVADGIGHLVFKILIPLMLFRMMATLNLEGIEVTKIWVAYFGVLFALWAGIGVVFPLLFRRELEWGVIASVSSVFGNSVMVGIPVISLFIGDKGILIFMIILSIHLPFQLTIACMHNIVVRSIALHKQKSAKEEMLQSTAPDMKDFLRTIFHIFISNPVMIALLLGAFYRFSGLPWFELIENTIAPLAKGATGLALFALGMSLDRYGIKEDIIPGSVAAFIKLIMFPILIFISAHILFQLPQDQVMVLVLAATCPTGITAALFADSFQTGTRLATNTITLSMLFSIPTITIWLYILQGYFTPFG